MATPNPPPPRPNPTPDEDDAAAKSAAASTTGDAATPVGPLVKGLDYIIDPHGRWIFTAYFLRRRGYCCKNACLNCPYKSP